METGEGRGETGNRKPETGKWRRETGEGKAGILLIKWLTNHNNSVSYLVPRFGIKDP
jgi:hypothetical protein